MNNHKIVFSVILWLVLVLVGSCTSTRTVKKQDTIQADYSKYQLVGPRKRVFVSEFENKSAYGQRRLGSGIKNVLETELSRTNLFLLLEREKLDVLVNEQKLGLSGFITAKSAPKAGQLLGANAVIIGSVTQFGVRTETYDVILTSGKKQIATCAIDVKLIDVSSGRIIWAGSGQGEATRKYTNILGSGQAGGYDETLEGDALRAAVVRLMENLVPALNNIPWYCTIAQVSDRKIYVNAGQKSNLTIGSNLVIYKIGKEIIDPTNGLVLGREEEKIGLGQVSSYFGEDGAVLVRKEGESPSVGDICKFQ